ncbi:hypothetical protein Tco_0656334 [Tanacetum coccineum]|uniref:Reverse transcriptase domain-containing protein n=1 Tax=Tanacetum coccineum TaxID=301880 RepID=A0ABQ4X937_9ASTR
MTTPVEKRNNSKFCEFHGEVRHNTDECMHLRRQIEELIKSGKLSHVIKELKQGSGKDQPKVAKKGETSGKDKPLAILMVQPWQRVARQRITQKIGGHFIHRIYVDGGLASEILYRHCFNRLYSEVKKPNGPCYYTPHWFQWRSYMAHGTNIAASQNRGCGTFNLHMDEFRGGEIIISVQWDHSKAGVRKIQAIPSTAHEMLKFPVPGGILTLRSSRIIPLECMMVSGSEAHTSNARKDGKHYVTYSDATLTYFAWKPADMTGVLRQIAKHRLNVREGCLPVRQKKRSQA